ncbi:MAG: T9SS type A sorting domain-containing protein [Crocinitomicaceae bacterium]
MKFSTTLLFVMTVVLGTAQITITPLDFAAPGDTVMMSTSDETTLDLVTTGAGASWDFSMVAISAQAIDTFYDVSDAEWTYQFMFNNSWDNPDHMSDYYRPWVGIDFSAAQQFGIDVDTPIRFTDVDTNRVENTGIGMYVNGYSIPAKSDTIDNHYFLPMNYGDSWTSRSYTNVDLNPAFNGIFRRYQQRYSIVDGWGQITTPFGTFDAIRVKSLVVVQDSVYADFGFGGDWYEMPTPDQVEYDWFTNGQKTPIFSVITQDAGGSETITSVKFKDKKRYFASVDDLSSEETVVFPNPAQTEIKMEFATEINILRVYDLSGALLIEKQLQQSKTTTLNVSHLQNGQYMYTATGDTHQLNGQFTVSH